MLAGLLSTAKTGMSKNASRPALKLNWSQIGILYRREMRAAFRERTILVNSILIPLLLYPLLLWIAFSGLTFIAGQTEGFKARIAVTDWPPAQAGLRHALELNQEIEITNAPKNRAELVRQLEQGRFDAILEFLPPANAAASLPGNFQAHIT